MTSPDELRHRAEVTLRALREELDERRFARDVDEPVDRALATFRFDWRTPPSIDQFHRVIGALVTHVYARGLTTAHVLSPTQATAEAIELLEVAYQGTHEVGYDGALLDAITERGSGIDTVLAQLAEIIKLRQRHRCRQWAIARHLDPLDWPLHCAIVAVILEQRRAAGDLALAVYRAEQLVDDIPELLDSELRAEAMLDQLVACAIKPR